ncbi:MAG: hypothetical protein E7020_06255 [Alphaproteobacteria bacterium]|nr:hypothetical protein [Alphaproteobacteria bacterium]
MKKFKAILLTRLRWVLGCLGFNVSEVRLPQPQQSNTKQNYPTISQRKVDSRPKVQRKRLGMQNK